MRAVVTKQLAKPLERHPPLRNRLMMRRDILPECGKRAKSCNGEWKVDAHGVSIRPARAMPKCKHHKSRGDYKVICAPNSTTRPGGSWKYAVAGEALRAMMAKIDRRTRSMKVAFFPTP